MTTNNSFEILSAQNWSYQGSEWFRGFCAGKLEQYGDKFCPEALAPQFIKHKAAGDRRRIKVRFTDGREVWGYVGVTTGWVPCFILMRRRGQHGSCDTLSVNDVIVDVKDIKR